ncbi:MAG: cytochrome c oxidase assembly protein [Actinomycetota bacterium]|nr:cytochrome c oxidase assembly protein [Actinomycetota bacterium]
MVAHCLALAHAEQASGIDVLPWLLPALVATSSVCPYVAGALSYRRRRLRRWSGWRTTSWLIGTALLAVALSPVPEAVGDEARGHMLQHLLIGMFAPLGLVLAAPMTLFLGIVGTRQRRVIATMLRSRALHVLGHPVTAGLLNVGGMFALYLTPLFALSARHDIVHGLVHLHFLVAGYLFAWAIAGPDAAPRRPGLRTRVTVLLVAGAGHGYLAKVLYARAGELPPGSGFTVAEMEAGAQWMYYGGDIAEVLLAAALFAFWYRSHRDRPAGPATTKFAPQSR